MALPQPAARFERADFFAWEAEQPMKHDYVAGEVFAQAGARQDHVVVALNIATSLRQKLRGGFKTAHPAPGLSIGFLLGHPVQPVYCAAQSGPRGARTPETRG